MLCFCSVFLPKVAPEKLCFIFFFGSVFIIGDTGQGQLLLRPEEYFPGELPGEEDCDGSGQERRNTSNSHSSIRMEDTLLARSFCQSTSLQQLVKHCIYLMYLFQIQIFCLWFGLAGSSHSSRSQSPNLTYSKGVGSPVVALPIWWAL